MPIRPPENVIAFSGSINGGMITSIDGRDIPENAMRVQTNFINKQNGVFGRFGVQKYTPTKPNSNPVQFLFPYSDITVTTSVYRHTASTLHRNSSPASWIAVTGAGFAGGVTRWRGLQIDTGYVFANNAGDYIQFTGGSTYARLGNAPVATYLASYGNRVVAAKDATIYWSGDQNYTEWNAAVDISAGFSVLADNSTDKFDNISDILVVGSYLCVVRTNTIWVGTLQASASNPFYFRPSVTGIGCDCPDTIAHIPDGFCFADFRSRKVYMAKVIEGAVRLEDISAGVFTTVVPSTANSGYGSYDPVTDEYWLWQDHRTCNVYAFKSKTWYKLELSPNIVSDIVSIHNYRDMSIANTKWFGMSNGEILYGIDIGNVPLDDGNFLSCSLVSKIFASKDPQENLEFEYLTIFYREVAAGSLSIRIHDGITNNIRAQKFLTLTETGLNKKLTIKKVIVARAIYWDLIWAPTTASNMLQIDEFSIRMHMIGNV